MMVCTAHGDTEETPPLPLRSLLERCSHGRVFGAQVRGGPQGHNKKEVVVVVVFPNVSDQLAGCLF